MPELPEVETVRRTLEPFLAGRKIEAVSCGRYRRSVASPEFEEFSERLSGRTVQQLSRRGKFLLLELDSLDTVTIHLRMTGELRMSDPASEHSKHLHIWIDLDNRQQLRYYDVRKFGRWTLLDPTQFELFDRALGPEPFDANLTDTRFAAMLASRKRVIKPLLLDQSFIAGIGNIYADEALFRAGINPHRHARELSGCEAANLLREIRTVLEQALINRGTTLRDYRDGTGLPGDNLGMLQIYSRPADSPCPRCGTPIVRAVIGQRGTKFCPVCQPSAVE